MKNKYLGIVCIIYSIIILYVWITDKLKNFLAPTMQIYLKISCFILIIIGFIMIIGVKKCRFKTSDLILLLPIVFLILSTDGRLTTQLAGNRTSNFGNDRVKSVEKVKEDNNEIDKEKNIEDKTKTEKEEVKTKKLDNIYFDLNDEIYFDVADYITYNPKSIKFINKTIKVRGFVINGFDYMTDDYFAIGKYGVSCCTADASFSGFYVKYNDKIKIINEKWYEIEGILRKGKDTDGYDVMYIELVNAKEINSKKEEQYVYPCYSYDTGKCKTIKKYKFEY